MASDASPPLMRQYNSIKQQVPKALLMFRLGDFYELFYDDAVVAARELEITLTARNKEKGAAIPMCGVPYHSAEGYIGRLIQKGYRVAICDQMEDPRVAKKLVKREITRTARCATTSSCSRSTGAVWRSVRRRCARPGRFCITCRRRSARRSIISTVRPTTIAPKAWCWMRSACGTWSWWSRCSRARA